MSSPGGGGIDMTTMWVNVAPTLDSSALQQAGQQAGFQAGEAVAGGIIARSGMIVGALQEVLNVGLFNMASRALENWGATARSAGDRHDQAMERARQSEQRLLTIRENIAVAEARMNERRIKAQDDFASRIKAQEDAEISSARNLASEHEKQLQRSDALDRRRIQNSERMAAFAEQNRVAELRLQQLISEGVDKNDVKRITAENKLADIRRRRGAEERAMFNEEVRHLEQFEQHTRRVQELEADGMKAQVAAQEIRARGIQNNTAGDLAAHTAIIQLRRKEAAEVQNGADIMASGADAAAAAASRAGSVAKAAWGLAFGAAAIGAAKLFFETVQLGFRTATDLASRLGEATWEAGMQYQDMTRIIVGQTGMTEEMANRTKENVKNILSTGQIVDPEVVTGNIGIISKRLNLEGKALEDFTTLYANTVELLGDKPIDPQKLTGLLTQYKIPAEDYEETLEKLVGVSQKVGIDFNLMVDEARKAGPALQNLGLDLGQAVGFFAELDKSGVDARRILFGLNTAVHIFAEEGVDPAKGFLDALTRIQDAMRSGDTAAAMRTIEKIFGPRNTSIMEEEFKKLAQGLKDGEIDVGKLEYAWREANVPIQEQLAYTETLDDAITVFGNQVSATLGPVGEQFVNLVTNQLGGVNNWIVDNRADIIDFGKVVIETGSKIIHALASAVLGAGESIAFAMDYIVPIYTEGLAAIARPIQLFGHLMALTGSDTGKAIEESAGAIIAFNETVRKTDFEEVWGKVSKPIRDFRDQFLPDFTKNMLDAMDTASLMANVANAIGENIETIPGEKKFKLTGNIPEVSSELEKLGIQLQVNADGTVEAVTVANKELEKEFEKYLKTKTGQDIDVKVNLNPRGPNGAPITDFNDLLPGLQHGPPLNVPLAPNTPFPGTAIFGLPPGISIPGVTPGVPGPPSPPVGTRTGTPTTTEDDLRRKLGLGPNDPLPPFPGILPPGGSTPQRRTDLPFSPPIAPQPGVPQPTINNRFSPPIAPQPGIPNVPPALSELLGTSGAGGNGAGLNLRIANLPRQGLLPGQSSPTPSSAAQKAQNEQLAQYMFPYYFSPGEWGAFRALEMKEAGFDSWAKNPGSSAFGMGQFLDTTWAEYGHQPTADPATQLHLMFQYIQKRYGTPSAALAFHNDNNYYARGGFITGQVQYRKPRPSPSGGGNFDPIPPEALVPGSGPVPPQQRIPGVSGYGNSKYYDPGGVYGNTGGDRPMPDEIYVEPMFPNWWDHITNFFGANYHDEGGSVSGVTGSFDAIKDLYMWIRKGVRGASGLKDGDDPFAGSLYDRSGADNLDQVVKRGWGNFARTGVPWGGYHDEGGGVSGITGSFDTAKDLYLWLRKRVRGASGLSDTDDPFAGSLYDKSGADNLDRLVKDGWGNFWETGIPWQGHAAGSLIHQVMGGPRGTDTVPAWLTPGEFVINKAMTESWLPVLMAINSGKLGKGLGNYFEGGGPTDTSVTAASAVPGFVGNSNVDLIAWMKQVLTWYNGQTGSELSITADRSGFAGSMQDDVGHANEGGSSLHDVNRAVDIGGPSDQLAAFAQWWHSNPVLLGMTRQLIHDPTPQYEIYGGQDRAARGATYGRGQHGTHIHLGLEGIPGADQVAAAGALPGNMNPQAMMGWNGGSTGFGSSLSGSILSSLFPGQMTAGNMGMYDPRDVQQYNYDVASRQDQARSNQDSIDKAKKNAEKAREDAADAEQKYKDIQAQFDEYVAKGKYLSGLPEVKESQVEDARKRAEDARDRAEDAEKGIGDAERRAELDAMRPGPQAPWEKDKGKRDKITPDENAKALGQGLVEGVLEGFGFDGSLFANPLDWNIWKLFTGGANYAAGLMQNIGTTPTGLFGPGGPFEGMATGPQGGGGGAGGGGGGGGSGLLGLMGGLMGGFGLDAGAPGGAYSSVAPSSAVANPGNIEGMPTAGPGAAPLLPAERGYQGPAVQLFNNGTIVGQPQLTNMVTQGQVNASRAPGLTPPAPLPMPTG